MTLFVLVTLLAVVSALALWWHSRGRNENGADASARRASTPRPRAETGSPSTGPYAAVEIKASSTACDAAKALAGRTFLTTEAPALPLDGCTEPRCRCSFQKLADRRQESRRWTDDGVEALIYSATEKRKRGDRRGSD